MSTTLHRPRCQTAYELAAINRKTGERIFICVVTGKSRRKIQKALFRELTGPEDTRMSRVVRMTGESDWHWCDRADDGCESGNWQIRFTGRTALAVDQSGEGRSIYNA